MCILLNDQIRVTSVSTILNSYHFFNVNIFNIPPSTYLKYTIYYFYQYLPDCAIRHENLFLLSNCNCVLVDQPHPFLLPLFSSAAGNHFSTLKFSVQLFYIPHMSEIIHDLSFCASSLHLT
jgi:hypothetical protein